MKRIQDSVTGKVLSVVLMLCMTFLGTRIGLMAVQALPYLDSQDYQDTSEFYYLCRNWSGQVASLFAVEQQLETGGLSYVEQQQLSQQQEQMMEQLDCANTNFRFVVRTADGEIAAQNLPANSELAGQVEQIHYGVFTLGEYYVTDFDEYVWSETHDATASNAYASAGMSEEEQTVYTIEYGAPSGEQLLAGEIDDEFFQLELRRMRAEANFSYWTGMAGRSFLLAALCLLYILWTAGHKAGEEGIVLTWQERIFFDLYLLIMALPSFFIILTGFYFLFRFDWWQSTGTQEYELFTLGTCIWTAVCVGALTLILRTFVVRLKARCLAQSTLLCRVLMWLWRTARDFVLGLPLTWKAAAVSTLYFILQFFFILEGRYNGFWHLICILLDAVVLLALCWWTVCFHKIRKGSAAIAAGDLSRNIDSTRMPHDLKEHAEALNNISIGLQSAVNEQMKSERFRAELITNVSHDLKTPLTSIINYVDLLKTTQQEDSKAVEYIEVLDRKAQRLKKLTEDLVEASKASTGTLSVNREKIGMGQLIDQALGEYEEKLEDRHLTVVTNLPEDETFVYADGRHLWRVIDNLLSNCCKYAMEGTRVYLELTRGHGQVVLSVKNISREPLNVPPERLMERFVRGDESRTTEGSGLGLSIARSLTELQGGSFELAVDGDLFKAIVTMPQAG